MSHELAFSIQIFGSTFEHAIWHEETCGVLVDYMPFRAARNDFIANRMTSDGWCPTVVEQIRTSSKIVSLCCDMRLNRRITMKEVMHSWMNCDLVLFLVPFSCTCLSI